MIEEINEKKEEEKQVISSNEQRIRQITHLYYSRKDVQKSILQFSQNRETIPRFFENFGKRPDTLQYESDVFQLVQKGATSFHCSEELWSDPLKLSRDLAKEEMNDLREGWDLLIDIDSKYIDYSKIAAQLIIEALEFHRIKNIGIKFSGSKGFHIIVPWKAFPEEVNGIKTKLMFPEWPRIIITYLTNLIKTKLINKITELENSNKYIKDFEASEKVMPDLILVSPRHLFRCPYSLHEKTSLASIVINKDELKNFDPNQANPMKVKIITFIPTSEKNEAKELLVQALDWYGENKPAEKQNQKSSKEFKEIKITNISESLYPETIKKILNGMHDGKKRSLFILLNYFRSIGMFRQDIEKTIEEWNKKNNPPLKEGYIKSQLEWSFRGKSILPPNFNNPIYQDLGVFSEQEAKKFKNPVTYTINKSNFLNAKENYKKNFSEEKNKKRISKK